MNTFSLGAKPRRVITVVVERNTRDQVVTKLFRMIHIDVVVGMMEQEVLLNRSNVNFQHQWRELGQWTTKCGQGSTVIQLRLEIHAVQEIDFF